MSNVSVMDVPPQDIDITPMSESVTFVQLCQDVNVAALLAQHEERLTDNLDAGFITGNRRRQDSCEMEDVKWKQDSDEIEDENEEVEETEN
eukprot:4627243-Ditylum_brightwellii.AAC.1